MAFTYNSDNPPKRDIKSVSYALYRARMISRDTSENPPFSYTDEEWVEYLEDTSLAGNYQFFEAVAVALATNPERLTSLTEIAGTYNYVDLTSTLSNLRSQQAKYNAKYLGVSSNFFGSVSTCIIR